VSPGEAVMVRWAGTRDATKERNQWKSAERNAAAWKRYVYHTKLNCLTAHASTTIAICAQSNLEPCSGSGREEGDPLRLPL